MSETPSAEPMTIWLDCQITRRKHYHVLTDGQGRVITKSRALSPILAQLVEEGRSVVGLALGDDQSPSIFATLTTTKDT